MATINYRLQQISADLFIKYNSAERSDIQNKVNTFEKGIKAYFGNSVSEILLFGSYKRDTILPRKFDEHSDIDILVVFDQAEREFIPETYRSQLKRFASTKYPTTKILKDHPSVVLEMSKIKFDLVPCRYNTSFWGNSYQIPSKDGQWMDTDPRGFNENLTAANNKYSSIVKPIIRLLKCWNAFNGYPYASFELERIIADMNFKNDNYQTGFLYAIKELPTYNLTSTQSHKVQTLNNNAKWIEEYLDRDNQDKATEVVYRILGLKL